MHLLKVAIINNITLFKCYQISNKINSYEFMIDKWIMINVGTLNKLYIHINCIIIILNTYNGK